jgi:hypothetical protein
MTDPMPPFADVLTAAEAQAHPIVSFITVGFGAT